MACCFHKRLFFPVFATLLIAVVAVVAFFPWKSPLEKKMKALLEAQGFQNVQLTLSEASLHGLALQNLSLGDAANPNAQSLERLSIVFSPQEILSGNAQSLNATGLNLEMRQSKGQWSLAGQSGASSKASFALPTTKQQMASFPLDRMQLDKSRLVLAAENWRLEAPLNLAWQKTPIPQITYKAEGLKFQAQDLKLESGEGQVTATLNPDNRMWAGAWRIKDINISGASAPLPPLAGKGTLSANEDKIALDGTFESADAKYLAVFQLTYKIDAPQKSELVLIKTTFPWNEGTLSAQDVALPLSEARPVNVNLKLQSISLNALLQQLTGKRASGTGAISGTLPITLEADGNIVIHEGSLSSEGPGVIQMSPDVIPGDNAQITLVRDVLKNLKYTSLTVDVKSEADHRLVILMRVAGSNPEAAKGRPVQLNVKLTGDVLDFVQQNILSLTDPRKFLEKSGYAKP